MESIDIEDIPEQTPCLNPEKKEKMDPLPDVNEEKKEDKVKKGMLSGMTLEPMWFGVTVSFSMAFVAFKNLFLERACLVDLGYSYEECFGHNGHAKPEIEMQAQKIVTSLSVLSGFIGGFITSLVLVFLGPWSDNSGRRKPLIILPLIGMLMCSASLLIMQAFPHLSTVWVIYAEVIPLSLGGNFSLLVMASFSYLGDICYKTGRCTTTVMGNNTAFITLFIVIGSLLAPVLYRYVGFVGMFSLSLLMESTSLIYAIMMVKDINIAKKIPNIMDLTLPLQSLKCIFKKREGHKRLIVLLMVLVPCSHSVTFINEAAITYLYTRNKFGWSEVEFGIYSALKSTILVAGNFTIVYLFKKKMQMRDEMIGLLGALSQLSATVVLLFSFESWMVFASTILVGLSRGVMIAERPVLNKQITASEQGKISSITAVLEKCVSFIIVPLSNYIYNWTLKIFPSCFLVISIVACLIQIACYGVVCRLPKDPAEEKAKELEKANQLLKTNGIEQTNELLKTNGIEKTNEFEKA